MGEVAPVSIVPGHLRGRIETMLQYVEILDNQYNCVAAFAVASLLIILALFTLTANAAVAWKTHRHAMDAQESQTLACRSLHGESRNEDRGDENRLQTQHI